ncbi:MAG: sodium:proton antiporter [Sedimentisphaerales bacterium]|nr:sodium:proton antiporter [Sedimentisphaerales bacterium]
MDEGVLISLATIIVLGILAQYLAWRFRLPAILLLLVFGLLAGPLGRLLEADSPLGRILAPFLIDSDGLFGELLFPFVSLAVAVILFEGGLSLKLAELRESGRVVWLLVTVGAAVGVLATSAAAYWILHLPLELAVLLAAILSVTGPTVIIPLLRHVRPTRRIGSVIKWEGILIDPIGAILAVLVYEAITSHADDQALSIALLSLLKTIAAGGLTGLAGAVILLWAIRRHLLPDLLQNSIVLMFVLACFVGANVLQSESGLLAVTLMGFVMANQKRVSVERIAHFKEDLRVLLISILFIVLSARLRISDLKHLDMNSVLFLVVLIVAARPLAVALSTAGSKLTGKERLFLANMAPRGIVAAAVSSILALRLVAQGQTEAARLMPITFMVIIGTVAYYGLSSSLLGRLLGVSQPNPRGILLVGAHRWARQIAQALQAEHIPVLLADTSWPEVNAARMEGLPVVYGSIFAARVAEEVETNPIGRLLALTSNDEVNALASVRFAHAFGRKEVYQLPAKNLSGAETEATAPELRGRILFGPEMTFHYLYHRFLNGAAMKRTRLSEEFDFEAYQRRYGDKAIAMFLIDAEGRLEIFTADRTLTAKAGDTLISLVDPSEETA